MNNRRLAFAITTFLSLPFVSAAQETLRTFELGPNGSVSVTTDLFIKQPGVREYMYISLPGAKPESLSAFDVSRGQALAMHRAGGQIAVTLPGPVANKAEFRLRLHEDLVEAGPKLHRILAAGRYVFVLPKGFGLRHCSLPAQVETADGHVRVGVVISGDMPTPIDLEMEQQAAGASLAFDGNFLAMDNRAISYQLLDPKEHGLRLWLELYVDHPGQAHFYSQLRKSDNVSNPVTVDMDRGVELPTRIVTGKEANAIGDAPSPFPDDAAVLVADLGYKVPAGGSARLRSYQTATDTPNYGLTSPDNFRLERFIARTRTQYVLPPGWNLASMDQPGIISKTSDGRTIIDFVCSSSSLKLILTGRRGHI